MSIQNAAGPSVGGPVPPVPVNRPARLAFYLGLFSIIPCLGFLPGLAAVIMGIVGLMRARTVPDPKGPVRAWIGIMVGGLFAAGWLALAAILAIGIVALPTPE
jgi:hypothetical protein